MKHKILIVLTLLVILCGCKQDDYSSNNSTDTSSNIIREFKKGSKPNLSNKKLVFEKKDTEGNKLDEYTHLVGFEQGNYFFSYANEKNWIYAIGNPQIKELMPICHIPKSNDIFFEDVYNEDLIIGMGYWEGNTTCHYELFSISPHKNKKTLFKCVARGYPTVNLVEHYVIINLAEQQDNLYTSKLLVMDLITRDMTTIEVSKYSIENNLYNGTFTINAGGWKGGFCYEKVKMNKEAMEEDLSGNSSIYYYSFAKKKTEKLMNYPKKVFYISGSKDCFVTSDYLLKSPENSGKIWIKLKDRYKGYDIPGIVAGCDIKKTYQLSDNIIIINNDYNYYIYDLKNKTYYIKKYELISDSPEKSTYLSIRACKNQFAYLELDKNKLLINEFTLQGH